MTLGVDGRDPVGTEISQVRKRGPDQLPLRGAGCLPLLGTCPDVSVALGVGRTYCPHTIFYLCEALTCPQPC